MTPADEMRAAAKLLRDRTAEITQGHWAYQPGPPCADVVAEEGGWIIASSRHVEDDDFRWISLMSPPIAEPLACWLDVSARMTDIGCRMAGRESLSVEQRAARDFARTILGNAQ